MKKTEQKELAYFPYELDKAINERFGIEVDAKSNFDLFGTGGHVTNFNAKGALKKRIEDFVAGYMEGNQELGRRLLRLHNSIK